MKNILISIRPQWVVKILNGEKTIEVRKRFPSDYVGWVYIYCTKDGYLSENDLNPYTKYFAIRHKPKLTPNYMRGKVVARFWCDKVDEFYDFDDDLCKQACLDRGEMLDYLGNKNGYAIHITKLEIFDSQKIYEMKRLEHFGIRNKCGMLVPITRAPQSFCFIEIE